MEKMTMINMEVGRSVGVHFNKAVSEKLDENIAVVLGVNRSIFGICTNLWMSCKLLSRRRYTRKNGKR
jgi:hypothetical protein